jgi:Holliday junction resolvase RusA-like endonuclease
MNRTETRRNIVLFYNHPPIAKQSFKFTNDGRKYQPKEIKLAAAKVVQDTKNQLDNNFKVLEKRDGNGIIISFSFYFEPPSYIKKDHKELLLKGSEVYRNKRPDDDNLQKFYKDCLIGLIYEDDSLIVHTKDVKKLYSFNPKVVINLTIIENSKYIF